MMRLLAASLIATLLASASPALAQSGRGPAKPLRTLVYSVVYSATTTNEEQSSGFGGGGTMSNVGGSRTQRTANVSDDGTLTAAIIAATPDGGLVVDASYSGKNSAQPVVRIAVFPDGRLSYAPGTELNPATGLMLPLLSRGLVAERTIAVGTSWTVPSGKPAQGGEVFRVTAVNGDVATFAIDVKNTVPGARGFDENGNGVTVYDTRKLCPEKFDYSGVTRHTAGMDQSITTTMHLTATLTSDSFQ